MTRRRQTPHGAGVIVLLFAALCLMAITSLFLLTTWALGRTPDDPALIEQGG